MNHSEVCEGCNDDNADDVVVLKTATGQVRLCENCRIEGPKHPEVLPAPEPLDMQAMAFHKPFMWVG